MTHSQSVKVCAFSDAHVRASTSGGVLYVQVITLIIYYQFPIGHFACSSFVLPGIKHPQCVQVLTAVKCSQSEQMEYLRSCSSSSANCVSGFIKSQGRTTPVSWRSMFFFLHSSQASLLTICNFPPFNIQYKKVQPCNAMRQ